MSRHRELSKSFQANDVEKKWYTFWKEKTFFNANPHSTKPPFSLVMPPPNVTGVLHAGHALGRTIEDILVRWKRMSGFEVLWVPGTDHAGISTQTIVEQHLRKTKNIRRGDLQRDEFLKHVWEWKETHQTTILSQLEALGCSCDWSRLRFTLDPQSSRAVRQSFKYLFDRGLIYRGDYLVNWDTISQTAIADDEVEFEEREGFLWYVTYPVKQSSETVTIATTRPETILGDVAVAVSPKDERYQHLKGATLILPITNREIPLIEDDFVDPEFGTGAVKVTPAHDPNDYEIGLRHNLEQINIMTPDGCINKRGEKFAGLTMSDARAAIVKELDALGYLQKVEPHLHRVGVSYRSKAVIEPYLSKQWFMRMSAFSQNLRALVQEDIVKLIPSNWQNTYFHWIDHLRDWCISRQLWWGHRIPIWYHKDDPEKMICYAGEDVPDEVKKDPDMWWQDEDVLDTWYSSSLWPFSVLDWNLDDSSKSPYLDKFYPLSTMVTGHDILFFWVARMLMMGEIHTGQAPFKEVYLNSLIFGKSYWRKSDEGETLYLSQKERAEYDLGKSLPKDVFSRWEKMSKSKGNVLDPVEMIETYGADATRMALCASASQSWEIDLDRRRFEEFKNFSNKIWNGARFVLMHLDGEPQLTQEILSEGLDDTIHRLEDLWILSTLSRTIQSVNHHLENYDFDEAATESYDFFWKEFCAYYLEICKPYLFGKQGTAQEQMQKKKILCILLCQSIRLLHPMAPFITEELFSQLKNRFSQISLSETQDCLTQDMIEAMKSEACIVAPYPRVLREDLINKKVHTSFEFLQQLIYLVRNIRGEMQIPPGTAVDLHLATLNNENRISLIRENKLIVQSLAGVKKIIFNETIPTLKLSSSTVLEGIELAIPLPEELCIQEKERLLKEKEKLVEKKQKLTVSLSNDDFVNNAPENVVEAQRSQLDHLNVKLQLISSKLMDL